MPNNPAQAQDEARRKLADRLVEHLKIVGWDASIGFMPEEWRLIVAALRAQPERGGEEMREIERTIEQNLLHFVNLRDHNDFLDAVGCAAQEIAAIRALPLNPAKEEEAEG